VQVQTANPANSTLHTAKKIAVHAPTPESARLACMLLSVHLRNQRELLYLRQQAGKKEQQLNQRNIEISKGLRVHIR
jgi:hypothetical protein